MYTKVRAHIRKTKKGVIKVRSYNRNKKMSREYIDKLRKKYHVRTPVKVNVNHKAKQSDSLAHVETTYRGEKPVNHQVNIDTKKVNKNGYKFEKVLEHEFNHVVDSEKKVTKGKKRMRKGKSNKEHFASTNNF